MTDHWLSVSLSSLYHKSREISAARTLKLPWKAWRAWQYLHCKSTNWFHYKCQAQLSHQQSCPMSMAAFFSYGNVRITFTTKSLVARNKKIMITNWIWTDRDSICLTCSVFHRQKTFGSWFNHLFVYMQHVLTPNSVASLALSFKLWRLSLSRQFFMCRAVKSANNKYAMAA